MKDNNKEDDTVRYKNTLDSYDNSNTNHNNVTQNEKISLTRKNYPDLSEDEEKNTIDKLYYYGDELSIDTKKENYGTYLNENMNIEQISKVNEIKEKNLNTLPNSGKGKERYLNMNMFQFIDDNDCLDIGNDILNKQK